jgi:hypothetical protein
MRNLNAYLNMPEYSSQKDFGLAVVTVLPLSLIYASGAITGRILPHHAPPTDPQSRTHKKG